MIKNFLYLDEEKMYSLSSQIFEGVTEYILSESTNETEDAETQKGPIGSGRILGDILRQSDRQTEKKFLNDYSYTLFEKKLLDDKRVLGLSEISLEEQVEKLIKEKSFIKVKATATFNDMNSIKNTFVNFNEIGKALFYVTNYQAVSQAEEQLQANIKEIKDKNRKSKIQSQAKNLGNIDRLAKESGMHMEPKFLQALSFLLSYGFQDQLEVQMKLGKIIASANLKRSYLREEEQLMIRKYSRQTEVEFVLFGMVTQYQRIEVDEEVDEEVDMEGKTPENIKEALMNIVKNLTNMETKFTGRLNNEIIIDPIALYTEI